MKLDIPRKGRLQQGMIFSCCSVDGYAGCKGWGIVITARCDLAASKMPILNYLPVVHVTDWLKCDGFGVILSRCIAEVDAEILKLLKDLSAPETVLLATPVDVAIDALVAGLDKKSKKLFSSRAEKSIARWRIVNSRSVDVSSLREAFPKIYSAVLRELLTHRLAGYYYLPNVEYCDEDSCYVVLLRQIGSMPIDLALMLPEGAREGDVELRFSRYGQYLKFDEADEMALPLGVVPSPHVEHLMQAFGLLFGRIGLPDVDKKHIERIANPEGM